MLSRMFPFDIVGSGTDCSKRGDPSFRVATQLEKGFRGHRVKLKLDGLVGRQRALSFAQGSVRFAGGQ